MSRGTVPQAVRTDVRCARHRSDRVVHDGPDDPLIDPSSACAEEQRCRRMRTHKHRAPIIEPAEQGSLRRHSAGDCALLGALAEYPDEASLLVEVAKIEATELGDAYSGRVQQLDGCMIAQRKRVRLSGATLRGVQRGGG